MVTAATGDAEGRAALRTKCATDPATLARVAMTLHGQLGGIPPQPIPEPADAAAQPLDRRTCTPPGHPHLDVAARQRALEETYPDLRIVIADCGLHAATWNETPGSPGIITGSDLGRLLVQAAPVLPARAAGRQQPL